MTKDYIIKFFQTCIYLCDNGLIDVAVPEGCTVPCIREEDRESISQRLLVFLAHMDDAKEEKQEFLEKLLKERFPATAEKLGAFRLTTGWGAAADGYVRMLDYMASMLPKEVICTEDREVLAFAEDIYEQSSVGAARYFGSFILWMKECFRDTPFRLALDISKRSCRTGTEPYGLEQVLRLASNVSTNSTSRKPGFTREPVKTLPWHPVGHTFPAI